MPNFKLIVHCGRGTADWLIVTHPKNSKYPSFNGFAKKKVATRFSTIAQAEGAIKMHKIQHRLAKDYNKHKIYKVEVKDVGT